MGGDDTKSSDEELYRTHGEMTAVEVKHDTSVYRIRARLVPQCRVVLYYSTGVHIVTGWLILTIILHLGAERKSHP